MKWKRCAKTPPVHSRNTCMYPKPNFIKSNLEVPFDIEPFFIIPKLILYTQCWAGTSNTLT